MSIVFDVLSWAFILSGSAIIIIGSIGLVRLPDFYSRAHAAGMTDTLGAGLVVLGMMVEAGWTLNLARLAFRSLDFDKSLQSRIQINISRQTNIQKSLGISKIQVCF